MRHLLHPFEKAFLSAFLVLPLLTCACGDDDSSDFEAPSSSSAQDDVLGGDEYKDSSAIGDKYKTLIPAEIILAYPWILAVAFGLFRFFDILKPLGIHRFEKFPGAWGVMADDLLGGVYAGIMLLIGLVAFGILP